MIFSVLVVSDLQNESLKIKYRMNNAVPGHIHIAWHLAPRLEFKLIRRGLRSKFDNFAFYMRGTKNQVFFFCLVYMSW